MSQDLLDAFRFASSLLYREQAIESPKNPYAAFRRTFALTQFRIVMLEATEFPELQHFQRAFPRLRLDILNLSNESPTSDICQMVKRFLEALLKYRYLPKEIFYRANLWDQLVLAFSGSGLLQSLPEMSTKKISPTHPLMFVDLVFSYQPYETKRSSLPLFLIEMSNERFQDEFNHKDEFKLAVLMSSALLKELCLCRDSSKEFLAGRRIYGLLIGATDVEVCVAFPVFDDSPDEVWKSDIKSHVTIVFQSSHHFWRQSLLLDSKGAEAAAFDAAEWDDISRHCRANNEPELMEANSYAVQFLEKHYTKTPMSDELVRNRMREISAMELKLCKDVDSEQEDAEEADFEQEATEEADSDVEMASSTVVASDDGSAINWRCVSLVNFVAAKVVEQAKELRAEYPSHRSFAKYEKHCQFDEAQFKFLTQKTPGGTDRKEQAWAAVPKSPRTPTKIPAGSVRFGDVLTLDEPRLQPNVGEATEKHFVRAKVFTITKECSEYELKIYENPLIASSVHFPQLLGSMVRGNRLIMKLERLKQCDEVVGYFRDGRRARKVLAQLLLDMMGALRTLHEAGYVHTDVSPNNFGYNAASGTWQLFDFDCSMPIEESRSTKRVGGTGYIASTDAVRTGIFDTFDDYVALSNSLKFIFNVFLRGSVQSVFSKVMDSLCAGPNRYRVDIDQVYLDAFAIYCKEWECTPNDSSPSYLAGLKFSEEIKHKRASLMQK